MSSDSPVCRTVEESKERLARCSIADGSHARSRAFPRSGIRPVLQHGCADLEYAPHCHARSRASCRAFPNVAQNLLLKPPRRSAKYTDVQNHTLLPCGQSHRSLTSQPPGPTSASLPAFAPGTIPTDGAQPPRSAPPSGGRSGLVQHPSSGLTSTYIAAPRRKYSADNTLQSAATPNYETTNETYVALLHSETSLMSL